VSVIFRNTGHLSDKHSHDEIAKFLGVPANPFDVMFPAKATEMKRMVLDYIKILRQSHLQNSQHIDDEMVNGLQKYTIKIDESGFPVAPRPQSWSSVKKNDIEQIYRMYMTVHYRKFFLPPGQMILHRPCKVIPLIVFAQS
jgi:hypothetical protein